jgi:hypothetical protein
MPITAKNFTIQSTKEFSLYFFAGQSRPWLHAPSQHFMVFFLLLKFPIVPDWL